MKATGLGLLALCLAAVNMGTALFGASLTVTVAGGVTTLTIALLAVSASIQAHGQRQRADDDILCDVVDVHGEHLK